MKKLILLFFVLILFGIGVGIWFINGLIPSGSSKTPKRFIVGNGETATQIGQELAREHIIKDALVFRIYSQITQSAKNIKPGLFELSENQSVPEIVNKLLAGPTEIWVTIPEGLRREEIANKFVSGFELTGKVADSFYKEFLRLTDTKEGFLFPDTYLMARDTTPAQVVLALENNFQKQYQIAKSTQTVNLTEMQAITIASIIQREAITPVDMQGVASVLENRLSLGMTLGSDVTLEYELGFQKDTNSWWKENLTADDLLLNNPYNTRINAGLPPTPISNPGIVAIKAALNPPQTDYLYYLSDKSGVLHFAKTLDEHNANIQKYLQ